MAGLPNNNVIGVIKEPTSGTKETVVYNLRTYDESLVSPTRTATQIGRQSGRKSLPAHTHLSAFAGTASFMTDFRGSASATTKPKISDLLESGGFAYTGAAAANTFLLDGTTPCDTLTYTLNVAGCGGAPKVEVHDLIGAVPALTISAEAVGAPIVLGVELTGGHIEATADSGTLPAYTAQDTTTCLSFLGGVYTMGGTAVDLQSWSLAVNPTIAPFMDATNTVTNIARHAVTDLVGRQLTFSYTKPLLDTKDWSTEFKSETIYSTLVMEFISSAGDTGKLEFTNVQVVEWGDDKGDSRVITNATANFDTCTITFDY